MIHAAIIGVGYWGPNLLRNLADNPQIRVKWVCDLDTRSVARMAKRYPYVQTTQEFRDLTQDPELDLIAISTPVHTHAELAISALNGGKHVLVTKPMASTVEQCLAMIEAAEKNKRVLMIDHTFVYHPAIQYMKESVKNGDLGDLLYFQSSRMNLGLYQPDVSVILDLMPHDLSILNELVSEDPVEISVSAKHAARLPQPDIAYLQLNYASDFIASVHASWLSPSKVRQTFLTGSKKMLEYNDNDVVQKIKLYDKGVDRIDFQNKEANYTQFIQYRQGDIFSPALPNTEALKIEIDHLVDCIQNGTRPRTDGREGLRVVRLLEAADRLARSNKNWVPIDARESGLTGNHA